jgi:hypothetical protein
LQYEIKRKSKNIPLERSLASLASENINLLSERLCYFFENKGADIAQLSKAAIVRHMEEFDNVKSPSPGQMIKFLNRNKNFMTCGKEEKNYMAVSLENGRAYDQLFNVLFFDELLTEDESEYVDVNAISYHRGEPETVLDFMYREYNDITNSDGKRNEIKSLIDTFEEEPLFAKRYAELLKKMEITNE